MEAKRQQAIKGPRNFDSAYGFSFAIALGLILFIAGLIITVFLSEGGFATGLVFGIPLLIAGLVVTLFMMRDVFARHDVARVEKRDPAVLLLIFENRDAVIDFARGFAL